eukprot:UN03328
MPLMSPEMQQQAMNGQNPWMGGGGGGAMGGMPDPSQMTILIQEEEWNLNQDKNNKDLYIGSYSLRQRPQLPKNKAISSEHAPVNMIFDCEVYIGQNMDKINEKKNDSDEKNPNDPNNGNDVEVDEEKMESKKNVDNDSDECAQEEEEQEAQLPIVTEFDDLELD